jgi:hypothetical protein
VENNIYVNGGMEEKCCIKTISSIGEAGDLFTVSAPVKVLEIIGVITTNIGASSTPVKLLVDPTEPATNTDLCALLDLASKAAGTVLTITGTFANAMVGNTNGVKAGQTTPFICPTGKIEYYNDDDAETGVIDWCIRYQPLTPGAVVTAA